MKRPHVGFAVTFFEAEHALAMPIQRKRARAIVAEGLARRFPGSSGGEFLFERGEGLLQPIIRGVGDFGRGFFVIKFVVMRDLAAQGFDARRCRFRVDGLAGRVG